MNFLRERKNIITIFITLMICFFPLCYQIDNYCIQSWDESRNVINAIEMLENHNWFVRYFDGKPDMWELKPPLLIWFQAASFKVFGLSEWSARLPSMLFSMGTVVLLMILSVKITKSLIAGSIASIILTCSQGYIGLHVARFGDHDVVLCFFSTAFITSAYLFLKTEKNKYLIFVFISFLLAWFTKSIIIFMFLPSLFIWITIQKKWKVVLINRYFWIGLISSLGLMVGYYLWRESQSPDYIHQVYMNEWFGRYFDTSTNYHYHKESFWYYWQGFIKDRYWPFIVIVLAGILATIFIKKIPNRTYLLYLALTVVSYFFFISAGTKNFWYDAPLYPIMALFLGILFIELTQMLRPVLFRLTAYLGLLFLLYPAYKTSVLFATQPDKNKTYPLESICYYLKDKNSVLPKDLKLLYEGHLTPLKFYFIKHNRPDLNVTSLKDLKVNNTVLINPIFSKDSLDSHFTSETIYKAEICEVRKLTSAKD